MVNITAVNEKGDGMNKTKLSQENGNRWRLVTAGLLIVFATALVTGVVAARYLGNEKSNGVGGQAPAPPAQPQPPPQADVPPPPPGAQASAPQPQAPAAVQHAATRPSVGVIEACNHYASSASR